MALSLATGARIGALALIDEADLDLDPAPVVGARDNGPTFRIRAAEGRKATAKDRREGADRVLPLSNLAVQLFRTALAIRRGSGPHVFEARGKEPLASGGVTREWGKLVKGGSAPDDVTAHDLRRSMRTHLGQWPSFPCRHFPALQHHLAVTGWRNLFDGLRSPNEEQRARFQAFWEAWDVGEARPDGPKMLALLPLLDRAKQLPGGPGVAVPWRNVVEELDAMRLLCARGLSVPDAARIVALHQGDARPDSRASPRSTSSAWHSANKTRRHLVSLR